MLNLLVITTMSDSDGEGPMNEFGLVALPGPPFVKLLGGGRDPEGVGDLAALIPIIEVGLFNPRVGVESSADDSGCEREDGNGDTAVRRFCTRVREKIAWDREEVAFIVVSPVFRLADPS
jgi:hypothetical protein